LFRGHSRRVQFRLVEGSADRALALECPLTGQPAHAVHAAHTAGKAAAQAAA